MLLTEAEGTLGLQTADRRALSAGFAPGSHTVTLLPAAVDPADERRLLGPAFADPWGDEGTLRRASRLVRTLLRAGGRGLVLHRAGDLALEREDALRRLGMATLGGEDVEISLKNPDADVELDSAESALLFACMLQVRENRFLADGELFHVPKDVRVGARGASATSRTGYRYFAHRGHTRVQLVRG
jgi:hypothetical protein